jgi:hypothetical protein
MVTEPFRIVAVVGNTKTMTVGEDDVPQLYQPLAQVANGRRRVQFVLRSATPPASARRGRSRCDATSRARSGHDSSSRCLPASGWRFPQPGRGGAVRRDSAADAGAGGGRPLRDDGVFSARRTQEIGIRVAMGATAHRIAQMVLRDAVVLVAIGSIVGVAIAIFLMRRPLAMFLVSNLTPADPLSLAAVGSRPARDCTRRSWGPTQRAARIDPAITLRAE